MRRLAFLILPLLLLFSCEKGEVEGVLNNEVSQNMLLGGWKLTSVEFQLVYNPANPLAWMLPSLRDKMQENLEEKIMPGSLYFMKDTVYYVIDLQDGTPTHVHAYGAYTITNHPATVFPENKHLVCNAYADYFYIKNDDGRMALYLTKDGVMKMLRDDESLTSSVCDLIERNIDDAQFYIYMERNNLDIYEDLERLFGN